MRIYLIGFMGSGKSHTGRRLAALLQYPFIELDQWIEDAAGMDIPAIFANKGEAWFREQEQQALWRTASYAQAVVSCGGGTPCFFNNMEWMNQHGLTVYLHTPADILLSRLRQETAQRPLLAGQGEQALQVLIEKKLTEREGYYQQASVIYSQKTGEEDIARELCRYLGGANLLHGV